MNASAEDYVEPDVDGNNPHADLWPPKPPNVNAINPSPTLEPKPFAVTGNSQLSKVKGCRKVYRSGGSNHEFVMMAAAGECSVKAHDWLWCGIHWAR
jgi:hypothetical protein